MLRTGDAAESAAGVASGADGGKRADTKAPSHAGGDGRATPRSTVSPVVEVKSGQAAGSTTAPGGGGGVENAKRGVVIRGTRGGRSARGGAVSRRSLGGGESARSASATNWSGSVSLWRRGSGTSCCVAGWQRVVSAMRQHQRRLHPLPPHRTRLLHRRLRPRLGLAVRCPGSRPTMPSMLWRWISPT